MWKYVTHTSWTDGTSRWSVLTRSPSTTDDSSVSLTAHPRPHHTPESESSTHQFTSFDRRVVRRNPAAAAPLHHRPPPPCSSVLGMRARRACVGSSPCTYVHTCSACKQCVLRATLRVYPSDFMHSKRFVKSFLPPPRHSYMESSDRTGIE